MDRFDGFLRSVLWEDELPGDASKDKFEIHRLKGRIPVVDGKVLLIQGVRNIYDMNEAKPTDQSDDEAKLVLIGRGINQSAFRESLRVTLKNA